MSLVRHCGLELDIKLLRAEWIYKESGPGFITLYPFKPSVIALTWLYKCQAEWTRVPWQVTLHPCIAPISWLRQRHNCRVPQHRHSPLAIPVTRQLLAIVKREKGGDIHPVAAPKCSLLAQRPLGLHWKQNDNLHNLCVYQKVNYTHWYLHEQNTFSFFYRYMTFFMDRSVQFLVDISTVPGERAFHCYFPQHLML